MLIVLALAWAYVRFGRLPEAAGLLYGVKPVVIAIVLQALLGLARAAVKSPTLGVAGAAAVAATAAGVHELVVLGAVGMAIALLGWAGERTSPGRSAPSVGPLAAPIAAAGVATGAAAFGLGPIAATITSSAPCTAGGVRNRWYASRAMPSEMTISTAPFTSAARISSRSSPKVRSA